MADVRPRRRTLHGGVRPARPHPVRTSGNVGGLTGRLAATAALRMAAAGRLLLTRSFGVSQDPLRARHSTLRRLVAEVRTAGAATESMGPAAAESMAQVARAPRAEVARAPRAEAAVAEVAAAAGA